MTSFTSFDREECAVFQLSGRFVEDDDHRDLLDRVALAADNGRERFVFDLANLSYINSSGINVIVKIVKQLNDKRARLVFTSVPEKINELLTIMKLNAVLAIQPSLEEGIQSLN